MKKLFLLSFVFIQIHAEYALPPLPYAYNALEPYIDAKTMEIHHTKHHQKYVDELNAALKDYPELRKKTVEDLIRDLDAIPSAIRRAVRNNGGGHANHSLFWKVMTPHAKKGPQGVLRKLIEKKYGSFPKFKKQFSAVASKIFGSGYAWLCLGKTGDLIIMKTANQDSPLSQGLTPLLVLDIWEHAYYLKYQNRRPEFIESWWDVVNWKYVEDIFNKAQKTIPVSKTRKTKIR